MNVMKMLRFGFVAFLAIATLTLVSLTARAQTPQGVIPLPTLPDFLPTGDILPWVVTNRSCYASVTVYATNFDGVYTSGNLASPTNFASLHDYHCYLLKQVSFATDWMLEQGVEASAPMSMDISVFYGAFDPFDALDIYATNFTTLGSISDATVTNLQPTHCFALVLSAGLQKLVIDVDSNPPYHYDSDVRPNSVGTHPKQYFINDCLVLDPCDLGATNRVRMQVKAGDKERTFTQVGTYLTPGILVPSDQYHVKFTATKGADNTVLGSEDYVTWTEVAKFGWWHNQSEFDLRLHTLSQHRFFKIKSE